MREDKPTQEHDTMVARTVSKVLPPDWFTHVVADGVDPNRPGIYEWRIDGVGVYIGQYGRIRRPTKEYGRNVARLLMGQPYRSGTSAGFRPIHRALADAVQKGRGITLTILENAEPDNINRRERELTAERGTLNGSTAAPL
jgi:hypothetical protein